MIKMITFIIISYNEKKYLKEAIDSCLNQELPFQYEILIGDDGSNDGSVDLIKEYKTKYPQIINYYVMGRDNIDSTNLIPSIRVSNNIKRAFSIMNGQYAMILSGDDLLVGKERIRKQIDFLEGHEDYSSCYVNYLKFGDGIADQKPRKYHVVTRPTFWAHEYMHISCFVFRKNITNHLLERFIDDTGLIFVILSSGKCKYIDYLGFAYRQRSGSIMKKADLFELNIIELMIFQDVLNYGGYKYSSLSRFSKALEYIYKNKDRIEDEKYLKYYQSCEKYKNNILKDIKNDKQRDFNKMIIIATISRLFFKVLSILEKIFNSMIINLHFGR